MLLSLDMLFHMCNYRPEVIMTKYRIIPMKPLHTDSTIGEMGACVAGVRLERPLLGASLPAGFPSPADDYIETSLDLNELLIAHPSATFFVRVDGDSMINAGINDGDILIVDRALSPANNRIVVAALDGYLTVKRLRIENERWFLQPENPSYDCIDIDEDTDFYIWGVVSWVLHAT